MLIQPVHPGDLAKDDLNSAVQSPVSETYAVGKPETRLITDSLAVTSQPTGPRNGTAATDKPSPTQQASPAGAKLLVDSVTAAPKTRLVVTKPVPPQKPRSVASVAETRPTMVAATLPPKPSQTAPVAEKPTVLSSDLEADDPGEAYSLSSAPSPAKSPDVRPHRLGSSGGPVVASKSPSVYEKGSPEGVDPGAVRANPFALRPTVQLAKRPSDSNEGVIYQPSSTTSSQQR